MTAGCLFVESSNGAIFDIAYNWSTYLTLYYFPWIFRLP